MNTVDYSHVYQVAGDFGTSDCILWIGLLGLWVVTSKWRHPRAAEGDDQERYRAIGRRRSRRMALSIIAIAILWPASSMVGLYLWYS